MPTTQRTGKKLLQEGKAKVVKRCPFTIQLKYATGEATQPIKLGLDIGYTKIGFSTTTKHLELISGTLTLRRDVSKKISRRRRYRRTRRSRLWYRKPRFLNRSKNGGWLAPSIQHKLDSHHSLVKKLKALLPISIIKVEVVNFDPHKMQHPDITGTTYQQGELLGCEIKEYLLDKWGRTCSYCGKTGIPLEVEHIIPTSRGGTNRVSNLTISCRTCNIKKGDQTAEEFGYPSIQQQVKHPLRAATCLNKLRWRLVKQLAAEYTYGYITKYQRNKLGLEKSHVNDSFVIAGGDDQERCRPYQVFQVGRNNRSLQLNRKRFKPSIRRRRYQLQPHDLIEYDGKTYRVKGVHCNGTRVMLKNVNGKDKSVAINNTELIKYGKGLLFNLC